MACGLAAQSASAIAKKPAKEAILDKEIKLGEDEPGCKDSSLLPRMPACSIIQCDTKEQDSLDIQVAITADGAAQKENIDGASEVIYYLCPAKTAPSQITKLAESTLVKNGFKVVVSAKDDDDMPLVTVMKDLQWVQISTYMYNEYAAYIQTAIKALPENEATSEALADEMQKSGRVALDGIVFEANKADLPVGAERILEGIASFLVRHGEWKIRVEAHTDGSGDKQANLALSQQRAGAVATWLLDHGIDKARLSILGVGDGKPLADASTQEGKARNARIELVRF